MKRAPGDDPLQFYDSRTDQQKADDLLAQTADLNRLEQMEKDAERKKLKRMASFVDGGFIDNIPKTDTGSLARTAQMLREQVATQKFMVDTYSSTSARDEYDRVVAKQKAVQGELARRGISGAQQVHLAARAERARRAASRRAAIKQDQMAALEAEAEAEFQADLRDNPALDIDDPMEGFDMPGMPTDDDVADELRDLEEQAAAEREAERAKKLAAAMPEVKPKAPPSQAAVKKAVPVSRVPSARTPNPDKVVMGKPLPGSAADRVVMGTPLPDDDVVMGKPVAPGDGSKPSVKVAQAVPVARRVVRVRRGPSGKPVARSATKAAVVAGKTAEAASQKTPGIAKAEAALDRTLARGERYKRKRDDALKGGDKKRAKYYLRMQRKVTKVCDRMMGRLKTMMNLQKKTEQVQAATRLSRGPGR